MGGEAQRRGSQRTPRSRLGLQGEELPAIAPTLISPTVMRAGVHVPLEKRVKTDGKGIHKLIKLRFDSLHAGAVTRRPARGNETESLVGSLWP